MSHDPLPLPASRDALAEDAELLLSGAADAAVAGRLSAVLAADGEARERFVALARLHGHLGEVGRRGAAGEPGTARILATEFPGEAPAPALRVVPRPRRWLGLAAATAAILALGLAVLSLAIVGQRTRELVPTVAVTNGGDVLRNGRLIPLARGLRLRAGDRVSVPVGAHLAIAFAGGRCEIGGASEAVVEATDRVHGRVVLASGSMSADVAGGDLFAVRTPDATIRLSDAAATIGVAARRTQVVVMRGAVEVATLDGAARTIGAGASWTSATLTEVATR